MIICSYSSAHVKNKLDCAKDMVFCLKTVVRHDKFVRRKYLNEKGTDT